MKIINFRKYIYLSIIFLASGVFFGCQEEAQSTENPGARLATIAVFSDPHYYDLSLGASGDAWHRAANSGRKMLAESSAITDKIVEELSADASVKIVLVTGDLTKDGERASHEKFAAAMRRLESAGKKVYVMPGNHDVLNPYSRAYKASGTVSTPNVTPEEFAGIYSEFGYGEAISRDGNSLSYVVEPTPGLWIVSMDASQGNGITGGRLSVKTLEWIKKQLTEAKEKGKIAVGMMHHGLVEHFTGQKINPISDAYVIDDWSAVASELSKLGLGMVFTGHFHANDITSFKSGDNTIYDIETGSLVTYPSPYRIVKMNKNGEVTVETKRISSINYDYGSGSFQDYARSGLMKGAIPLLEDQLKSALRLTDAQAKEYAPALAEAFIAHYYGDEKITPGMQKKIDDAPNLLVRMALKTILTDLPPGDNNVTFKLQVK